MQVVDQEPDGTPSNPPELETGGQNDDDEPRDQPSQDDEQNSPKVARFILSLEGSDDPELCTGS